MNIAPLDLSRLKVFPLSERQHLTRADEILVEPDSAPKPVGERNAELIAECVRQIRAAKERGAAVMLIYGATCCATGRRGSWSG